MGNKLREKMEGGKRDESSCWCTYEGIQKQMANNSCTIPISIGSMVTHFQLPPYEYIIEPPDKLRILLSGPTLWAHDFSLRSICAAITE